MHENNSEGKKIGMAYGEQYFQPKGGPAIMLTLSEQDLAREMPFAGRALKNNLVATTNKTQKLKKK
jgi:rRNA maturation protein Rpf1